VKKKRSSPLGSISYLYPYLKEYRRYFLFIFIAMIMVAVTSAMAAYMFKHILNDIFISKDEKMLIILPLAVIVLFMTRGISRFASTYLSTKVGVLLANRLRALIFSRLMGAEYSSMQKIKTGDINAVIIQTVLNIQNSISKTIPQLLISALTVLALIAMIIYTDWRLSLYAIMVGVLMVLPVKILGKGVKRHAGNSEDMITEMSNRINESFNNLDLVKIYNGEKYEKSLFEEFLYKYGKFQIKLAKYQMLSSPFMEFFIALAISIVIFVGGHYVIDGSMTAGDFFAFMVALMLLYAPIKNLTQNYSALYVLESYMQRVEQILSLPVEKERSLGDSLHRVERIEFRDVSYSIGQTEVLKKISFVINDGDRVAIVGKSGAGKSSMISLLFGLGKVTSGEILINGEPLEHYSPSSFRDQISYVNQNAGVFNISLRDNIIYGDTMESERYDIAKSEAQCSFISQMENSDLELAGEFGNRLSGGQRQRVALARALYRDGSLFVLDEATSALDANTESLIQQSLERVMSGRTTIIIAHRLSTIEKCNRVIVMEAGEIVASGEYDEVSRSEVFRKNFMMDGQHE